ncbi:nuclear transport factor 2 family protein [Cystobacter ferrugineus]|uniref:nuclear transport factor 2 family protein n=1 Tax=Cystobacter ferrugineus TaxID=83449 RepID=UPI0009043BB7|nr:nuclear transport factor 2 family protein [Cystobacter ferrugineus]
MKGSTTCSARRAAGRRSRRIQSLSCGEYDLLHDEVLFGHTNGHADDKATYLGKFKTGSVRYRDAEHQIKNVKVFGDAAIVSFHLKMRAELTSGSLQLNIVALTVWTLERGRWRMVAHQPTAVSS